MDNGNVASPSFFSCPFEPHAQIILTQTCLNHAIFSLLLYPPAIYHISPLQPPLRYLKYKKTGAYYTNA